MSSIEQIQPEIATHSDPPSLEGEYSENREQVMADLQAKWLSHRFDLLGASEQQKHIDRGIADLSEEERLQLTAEVLTPALEERRREVGINDMVFSLSEGFGPEAVWFRNHVIESTELIEDKPRGEYFLEIVKSPADMERAFALLDALFISTLH